mmetsp:Transcript_6371/g.8609  ORF Transcript_6371/g.8609 Transcript_6371/m.8609 type:complete len:125 (-) Transcript_6371:291-665(-)|eukprot:CAMPEP_0185724646 /NCGR_PEP_ID=MMETSP1171-20130828/1060_1 /TAXON_ID=374046 /ORGANISM="Helicotheca tamensis, Strain CCMP826" /LENGTH=124 /DNA_ID=CAMNT_0028392537 /DNA_START=65 /DNA_END=439 /DNA_ORIENTATION=-
MTSKAYLVIISIVALTTQNVSATGSTGGEAAAVRSARQTVDAMKSQILIQQETESRRMVEVDRKVHDISSTSLELNDDTKTDDDSSSSVGVWGVGKGFDASSSNRFLSKIVEVSSSVGNKAFRP